MQSIPPATTVLLKAHHDILVKSGSTGIPMKLGSETDSGGDCNFITEQVHDVVHPTTGDYISLLKNWLSRPRILS